MNFTKKLVIIPTYNEIENIKNIIDTIFSLSIPFDILIVDDNSPDGTALEVKNLQSIYPKKLFLEIRDKKLGLGTAYIYGFKWALAQNYDYIFEMDADFSHNPNDLCRLYNECIEKKADITIGSRYIKGVNVVNWPLPRILLSYGASLYVKIITGMKIEDPTSGFICYSRKVIEAINLDSIRFIGYAFQIEMKYKAYIRKFKLLEVPIIFTDRSKGKSKMNSSIIKEAIFGVIMMKLRNLFNRE
jgi:glycosyltransferase, group 2 family